MNKVTYIFDNTRRSGKTQRLINEAITAAKIAPVLILTHDRFTRREIKERLNELVAAYNKVRGYQETNNLSLFPIDIEVCSPDFIKPEHPHLAQQRPCSLILVETFDYFLQEQKIAFQKIKELYEEARVIVYGDGSMFGEKEYFGG